MLSNRRKCSQRTFPKAARPLHGLLGTLQGGHHHAHQHAHRDPHQQAPALNLKSSMDKAIKHLIILIFSGPDYHLATCGHPRPCWRKLDPGLRGTRLPCPNHFLAGPS